MIKGVIFDFDGTLVDSNKLHMQAYLQAAKEYGINLRKEALVQMFGIPGTTILKHLTELDDDEIEEVMERQRSICQDLVTEKGFPHESKTTIEKLKKMGFKVSIVTGAYESYVRHVTPKGLVDVVYGAESGILPKPAPDLLFAAAEDMGIYPKECVFVGDSRVDIEAAIAAEMEFIGIKSALSEEGLEAMNPKRLIEKISDILDTLNEYPKDL